MTKEQTQKRGHMSTTIIAVFSLVVATITAIPAFLSLNKEHASIYYSLENSGIQIPDSLDKVNVYKVLSKNGIPSDTVSISIINQGNALAKEVRISAKLPGSLLTSSSKPKSLEKPIWVTIPQIDISNKPKKIQFAITDFGITKKVVFDLGYQRESKGTPEIQIFYNGKPADQVDNTENIPTWNAWDIFKLPLFVLAAGLVSVLIWAIGVVISNNPTLRKELKSFALKVATEITRGLLPYI